MLASTYNPVLVVFSLLVAILASYTGCPQDSDFFVR